VTDLIEAAIASSVRSYVEARDYAARMKEAEHISFLAHELRNPLGAVKLSAVRLRQSFRESDEGVHLLEILERNVERLEALINGVLRVERLEVGKTPLHIAELELGGLLDAPIATAKLGAEAKGLGLTAAYDPHLLVLADPELATSAVSNVLDNAVKYTDSGGIRVVAEPEAARILIHVWDNCPGISQEELRIIFEPFERGHSKKPGSGLGLAIAGRALEAQGGSIGAESPEERGCHFWITLPRALH
jgi:signal transduction histidine kinase